MRANGAEKLITKNGGSCAVLIDTNRLDYYHRLEREHIHLSLLQETAKGMSDLEATRTMKLAQLKSRHGR